MPCCGQRKTYSKSNPAIAGVDEGGEPVEIIASVTVMGLRPGQKSWARGSHLDALLTKGWISLV